MGIIEQERYSRIRRYMYNWIELEISYNIVASTIKSVLVIAI